ncbi:MAG: alpha/beta fold hydrolase [Defluviimonas sp.]|uniref:alpha/beta hydrolase n=1 Tax=Albidovulum sp. TaxID=1872424 RepID=UPI001DDC3A3D|nr:alpha/beta fold hydrolase [Paracoccaceae bacterium]MCC0064521.1 alpha/beta fold hydrolase [Defluviimonas sp.]
MARTLRFLLATLGLLVLVALGLVFFGPREPLGLVPAFDAAALPEDLDTYLATREATVGGITPGVEKRILWAGARGAVTDWAVIYLHGFSATSEEIRPVPDRVAQALGANLYFTRFAGHGLGPDRFAGPSVNDWMIDTAEALAIGKRIGRRVLVIATSTGGTLAAEAALQPSLASGMDGIVFVSPNFRLKPPVAALLTWPLARRWVPLVAGSERCFAPQNPDHAKYWTTCYPTVALLPMAALAEHARLADYKSVRVPALFLFARADQVVSAAETEAVAARWGGSVSVVEQVAGPGDDPYSHVIAGRILSPSRSAPVSELIAIWARNL